MTASSNLLKVKGVKKVFQRKGSPTLEVLSDVNLELNQGERVAILGKSGAGKSTLLHVLGTLEAPTEGTVNFEGREIFKFGESELSKFRNKELGFVFQFHYLMLEFNALENVMMPALLAGESSAVAKKRATELLERVGLQDRLTHRPAQLSGGEQQRVAIARALTNSPKLLLTDEMTGNLDPVTGNQVFQLVQQIHKDLNTTLVSVTHDEGLAATYPRILRLEKGRLV